MHAVGFRVPSLRVPHPRKADQTVSPCSRPQDTLRGFTVWSTGKPDK